MKKENKKLKSIFNIKEDEEIPLFIFGVPIILNTKIPGFNPSTNPDCHLLMTIVHKIQNNTIELHGRMRYEATREKTIFTPKTSKTCTKENIEILKNETRDFLTTLEKETPFKRTKNPLELEFKIGSTPDQVLAKIKLSNEFDINSIEEKKI